MADHYLSYVIRTPEGSWRVAGTRVSLDSVVHAFLEGATAEEIAGQFPSVSLEQTYGAIAFYLRHRGEIDQYLAEQDAGWERMREASAGRNDPLLQRLRAMKAHSEMPRKLG